MKVSQRKNKSTQWRFFEYSKGTECGEEDQQQQYCISFRFV